MTDAVERRRIRVRGTVQGVGFRPFVFRTAIGLGLGGWVRNDTTGVLIEAEGPVPDLERLQRTLIANPPRLARVRSVEVESVNGLNGYIDFRIAVTDSAGAPTAPVGIDTATCDACLAEMADPADRRYRYPFTNCTDCGPRYTIVTAVPYDRPATTMAGFTMCARCQAEYDDPNDRRFHAQPNACPDCGPTLTLRTVDGSKIATGDDAMTGTAEALRSGRIVAVKGLGGYHLAVDATSDTAVAELRRRKHRDDKPFAVMVADVGSALALADLDDDAVATLTGPGRPVVLARKRELVPGRRGARGGANPGDDSTSKSIAPGLVELGIMLAYTPLHHLLLDAVDRPLVMTSGNVSDEPIAQDDDDAVTRLGPLVDLLLTHDRPIHIRCDDSVVRASGRRVQVLRRSRGYAPEPFPLPITTDRQILAVGAELKSTVAVARGATVVASHHIGDLEHLANYQAFRQAIEHLCHLYDITPEMVAHDLHPEYLSTKWAMDVDLPLIGVQHHHAHVASCLVEHGRTNPVVALAFDGTGYGTDDTLWGGEILVADLAGFERVAHLRPIAMPGAAAAIREPWRMAAAWASAAGAWPAAVRPGDADPGLVAGVDALVAAGHGPTTTSIGRLFDALAVLVTGRRKVSYEAQAAIELEALARRVDTGEAPVWAGAVTLDRSCPTVELDPRGLIGRVVDEVGRGTHRAVIAAGIHRAIGESAATLAAEVASTRGIDTVVLTGGVFQNVRLTEVVEDALARIGLRVLIHHCIPTNDAGISIGQAAIAAARHG